MNFTTVKKGSTILCNFDHVSIGVKKKFLLISDIHYDSKYCHRKLLKKDLDQAKDEDAGILNIGDLLDAMQGRFDPRKSYDEIRPEYLSDRYYDLIVEDAYEFFKPYAANFIFLGYGNHELATRKNAGTDLLDRLGYLLSQHIDNRILLGGYDGFVRFMFTSPPTETRKKGWPNGSIVYHYNHGTGGNAPVTRGVIQTNRQAVYVDADVVHNGHNHEAYMLPIKKIFVNREHKVQSTTQYHVRTPGYKDTHLMDDDWTNWEHQKGFSPKPLGSAWMTLEAYGKHEVDITLEENWK